MPDYVTGITFKDSLLFIVNNLIDIADYSLTTKQNLETVNSYLDSVSVDGMNNNEFRTKVIP